MMPIPPNWFLGKDVLIDIFSFLVLIAFVILCWRSYSLDKNKKIKYLGAGFLLIAIAQLAAIVTKIALYDYFTFTQVIGQMVVTYNIVKPTNMDIFYFLGFFFQKLLTLAGLFIIYRLPIKKSSPKDFIIALFLIIISAAYSAVADSIFHLTTLIFLILIISNYYEVYKNNKSKNTLILILAFGVLTLGHIIYFISESPKLFVCANLIELVSYLILLILMIRIVKYGKETKSNGYSIGYAGNDRRKRRKN